MQDEDFTEDTGRPSKTKQKEVMHELRDLGAELVELSVGQLKRINVPENIFDAVRECQKITAHGARRRQIQYLGKLMRSVDDEPIRAGLALLRGESSAETARLHRLERLRVRLLEDEAVLAEIAAQWPGVDLQHLRTLRRNALKEKENNKPPKNFRAIFQILQELDQKGVPAAVASVTRCRCVTRPRGGRPSPGGGRIVRAHSCMRARSADPCRGHPGSAA